MLAAAFLAATAGLAAAQAPATPNAYKIGFVNTEKVMRDSRASQQTQKALEAEFQKREKEIAGGAPREMDRRKAELIEDMNQRREDALKQFVDRTNGIIRRIAEAEKFDLVFIEAAYAAPSIDLTDKVIKALDASR
jgi:outer membrane protein